MLPGNIKPKYALGFTEEERRLRVRMAERGLRMRDIAAEIGVFPQDVTNVVRGRSKSPKYIAEVYKFLDLELPAGEGLA